jgi:hypothetical protein
MNSVEEPSQKLMGIMMIVIVEKLILSLDFFHQALRVDGDRLF